ncbi:unnamed protein product [Phaeothamnion confervicola]
MDKKLRKVLEMRTDSPVMLESLDSISGFFQDSGTGGTTLDARRSLRDDLEKQNYHLSACFLKSFERLKERLEGLETHVHGLEDGFRGITERLAEADSRMRQFSERAEALRHQRTQSSERAEQASAFLTRFQLSPDEAAALEGPLGDPDAARRFFDALARLRTVHSECARMAARRHQAAGFELLDVLSRDQERAFGRLYEWVQERCQELQEETPEADVTLQVAMRALRDRHAFYSHCQESILATRRKLLLQRFVAALTQGSSQRQVRPIEIQAHDPVRYVGDMLAWVHQAVAVERELLAALFGDGKPVFGGSGGGSGGGGDREKGGEGEPDAAAAADNAAAQEAAGAAAAGEAPLLSAKEVLERVVAGMAQPLHGRVSTVLHDNADPVVAYRLAGLLRFYCATLTDLIGSTGGGGGGGGSGSGGSALAQAAEECRRQAQARVLALLKHQGDRLVAAPPPYGPDLAALPATADAARRLADLLAAHAASLAPVDDGETAADVQAVLEAVVEPVLTACRMSAEGLDPSDTAVLMLNNAAVLAAALGGTSAAAAVAPWRGQLDHEVETWMAVLVEDQAERVLERCGLARALHQLQLTAGHGAPASARPGLDGATLAAVMQSFYSSLFALVLPDFERVTAPAVRAAARRRTALRVAEAHDTVHAAVRDPANGYRDTSFLVHTPAQVRMILDCD